MQIEQIKVSDLKAHPKNPRIHPESAINKMIKSLGEFGWTNPVLISEDNIILAGHLRVKVAERLDRETVPAIRLPLTGAKADAYLIADNRLQDETSWDLPLLKEILQDCQSFNDALDDALREELGFSIEATGFDIDEIESLFDDIQLMGTDVFGTGNKGGGFKKGSTNTVAISIGRFVAFVGAGTEEQKIARRVLFEWTNVASQWEPEERDRLRDKMMRALMEMAAEDGFSEDTVDLEEGVELEV